MKQNTTTDGFGVAQRMVTRVGTIVVMPDEVMNNGRQGQKIKNCVVDTLGDYSYIGADSI